MEFGGFLKWTLKSIKILSGSRWIHTKCKRSWLWIWSPWRKVKPTNRDKLLWRWKAEHVHDFMWAADRDYKHTKLMNDDGIEMNFSTSKMIKPRDTWAQLPIFMNNVFKYADRHFGLYPYKYFAYIQGWWRNGISYVHFDLREGKLEGLVGLATHEMIHSWYQGSGHQWKSISLDGQKVYQLCWR